MKEIINVTHRGGGVHMDCYEGIRKAREECSNADTSYSKSEDEDEDETSGDEHSNKDVKDDNERICEGPSPGKKRRGKNTKKRTKSQRRQTKKSTKLKGEGYSESPATEEPGCSISVLSPTPLELNEKLRKSQRGKKAPDTLNAAKWIRTFEELTVGNLMAVGDLKALLARVLGLSKLESVPRNGGLDVMDVMHDGITLDCYRAAMWTTLRREFPTHIDHKNMRGLPINDTENPASYLQAQVDRWRMETDEDPEIHPVFSVMFRNSVIEILPSPIKVKLDDVVGLVTNKSHRDFCDHVVHAVDKYR